MMAPATELADIAGARTYRGSCHCGAVRFECELDLAAGTQRCNCSSCSKQRFWKAMVPETAFRLLEGDTVLTDYQFGSQRIRHRFCKVCGIKPYGIADIPDFGRLYAVNVACLDGLSDVQRALIPVRLENGREADYDHGPAEGSYL
jgi:hypothetical protein